MYWRDKGGDRGGVRDVGGFKKVKGIKEGVRYSQSSIASLWQVLHNIRGVVLS